NVSAYSGGVPQAIRHVESSQQRIFRGRDLGNGKHLVAGIRAIAMRELERHIELFQSTGAELGPGRILARRRDLLERALLRIVIKTDGGSRARRGAVIGAQLQFVLRKAVWQVGSRRPQEHVGGYYRIKRLRGLVVAIVMRVRPVQPQLVGDRRTEFKIR